MVAVRDEVSKAVVGQDPVVTGLLAALLVGGHVLLEGVPGTAKTLMVRALAAALRLRGTRVQFTPDLMPSDITGQLIYQAEQGTFRFREGPVFTNLLIADEVNRTPPRTQAALLEAMEERQVSVEGEAHPLPDPFLVAATQNPLEFEGTYPLPEAQVDRFLFKLLVDYPDADQERRMLGRHDEGFDPRDLGAAGLRPVADAEDVARARSEAAAVRVESRVLDYIVELARATRSAPALTYGCSPRGATMLLRAAKAWAWLRERDFVTPDDVQTIALPTLRHRVQLRPEVELEGASADSVLRGLLDAVPVPR